MTFWYLATPYDAHPAGHAAAHADACMEAATLLQGGIPVVSPIAHTHVISQYMPGQSHAWWMQADRPLMNAARGLIVCRLPGFDVSRGVREEIGIFRRAGKPIVWMDPGVIPAVLYDAAA